ncbi:MAG: hypothetical protein FWC64_03570 [Treponema sp.]|nr:hypothetical protein [Treponema sp.]
MGKRRRLVRAGLLAVLLGIMSAGALFSHEPLELLVETFPPDPVSGGAWTLSVLVNHPNPHEVSVSPPAFPPSLALQQIRIESRTFRGGRWTSVEYSFTSLAAGDTALQPFHVSVPHGQALTGVTTVSFRPPADAPRHTPGFRWLYPAAPLALGERGELALELFDWEPSSPAPRGIFQGRAPRSAILTEAAPASTGEGVYRYAISVIPLEETALALEPFSFQAAGFTLTVPGITVPVLPAPPAPPEERHAAAAIAAAETLPAEAPEHESQRIPFPEPRGTVVFFLQGEYDRIVATVRALWEEDLRAQALAELRGNERDSLAGPLLVSLRRELEQALGLAFTGDERWRPLGVPLFAWVFFAGIGIPAAIALCVFRPRFAGRRRFAPLGEAAPSRVTSRRRGGFRNVIVLICFVGLALIVLEEGLGRVSTRRLSPAGRAAVLERTPAYRVPDTRGTVNVWFDEGQPVVVGAYGVDWSYVQSPDGRSGWVPRRAVISY